ncbi:GTP cyclohydrolase [Sinomicrobium weinanense]|uniref:GTP cyclohydrolase n=1 Tax=Sinomicrobium weinanense TaxID=2842200 RepID=A0A926JQS5_9FLAO|nr:GTP cyclohydrolase [Sinomicrobium weinanense]MBC9795646.1 GTP cyclohydrolase [Sinomicrobium weinanense]MBU3122815.1 GTP cyclohydrolase [Sinomicrobium weinanense]
MITVKEVKHPREIKAFVKFPFKLYKGSPYWVPPIIKEEIAVFDKDKNPAFENADARLFLAYKNGEIAGRIAVIINRIEIEEQQKKKVRFGWFDVIDEIEVTKALLDKVTEIGRDHGLEYMEGPVGFSQMDKAGMLVRGFDKLSNMTTIYNYPYYPEHFKALGFEEGAAWLEYLIRIPDEIPQKIDKFSDVILRRYKLRVLRFKSSKELVAYADDMFDLMNRSFKDLQSFVPIQKAQIEQYKQKYLKFIHPDFIKFIVDENDKMVAFSITMPSFSRALQKANGKLFPFGFLHILRAQKTNDSASLYLIGIDPKYQNKGLTAIIFKETNRLFQRRGMRYVESNPELEENTAAHLLWKYYDDNEQHKRRVTWVKQLHDM